MRGDVLPATPVRHGWNGWRWALVLACAWAGTSAVAAEKTDIVVLKNGDHLTGEIKKLERGLLSLSTDVMGTVTIEWPQVASITTRQYLQVEQSDGNRSYGHAADVAEAGTVVLGTDENPVPQAPLAMDSIVRITPLSQGSWLDHIDGHASVGLSAASANEDRQVTVSADMTYTAPGRNWTVTYDAARTESSNNPVSERQDLSGTYRWLRENRWYWGATAGLTRNDELDLRLRTLAGGGIGHYWVQDNRQRLAGFAGLVLVKEEFDGAQAHSSVEAALQGDYVLFRFDDPEIDLSASIDLYPSLTVSGRLRSELSLRARVELVKDLYYELRYLHSRDNKPRNDEAEETDWSLTSSLGYKF